MDASDRPASAALLDHVASVEADAPADLLTRLHTLWDWDDDSFRALVDLAAACLREISDDDVVPRRVAAFFAAYLQNLDGILRNPQFLAHNRRVGDAAYFERRRDLLAALVVWFAQGRCPYPPQRFQLG